MCCCWWWVLLALFALACLLKFRVWLTRQNVCSSSPGEFVPPISEVLAHPEKITYNLKDIVSPIVFGWKLKFVIWLSFTKFGRVFLVPWFLNRVGSNRLKAMYIPEKPTYYPAPQKPQFTQDHSEENKQLLERLVDQQVNSETKGDGFRFPSIADFVRAYKSKRLTPVDVAKSILAAIEDSDSSSPPLRAIVQTDPATVLEMARASAERWAKGEPLSLLDGVPVSVKEEFKVHPYLLHSGTSFVPGMAQGVPETVAVTKLKSRGAVIIGISNLQELGTGTLGSNPKQPHLTARNPYNKAHYPGGSSSGSAVSVAAGFCPISLGTDGGGSVRIPAALCGVAGLKPTYMLVDPTGVLPLSYSVGVIGPICSSVLDTAIAMEVISKDTDLSTSPLCLKGLGEERLDGMNIGVYWDHFEHAESEIVDQCKEAVAKMESLGANIVSIKIPELDITSVAHSTTIMSEFATSLICDTDPHYNELGLETLLVLSSSYGLSSVNFLNAQKQRTRMVKVMKHFFEDLKLDAIVSPGVACVAPKIPAEAVNGGSSDVPTGVKLMRYAFTGNLTGNPGLVLPIGYSSSGLPIGLQLMGDMYQDDKLLRIGMAVEKLFSLRRPAVFYDVLK